MPTGKEWEIEEDSAKSFLSLEAKVEIRKNYREITVYLDLVKVTGDI